MTTSAQLIQYQVNLLNRAGYRGNFEQALAAKLPGNMMTENRAGHVIVRDGMQKRNHGAVASVAYNAIKDTIEARFFA